MQSTTNFRSVSLKKEVGHFSRNLWPRICKKVKKLATLENFYFARNDLKHLKIRSQHHLCSPQQISGRYFSKKKLAIFQEICDPGYAKKVKKLATFEKCFFARNVLKRLKICSQHHLCSPRKISGRNLSKKKLVILQEISDPGYAKKVEKLATLEKFFFARNHLKRLKIRLQHNLCSPQQISGRYLSKKKLVIFQEICDPGYAKKVKKFQFSKKNFFARNNLKRLKIRSEHHLCSPRQISGRYFSKKKLAIFQEICDPGYAKKVEKLATSEKFFFARNHLKRLKMRSQHHLCSPRQISDRYFSKK